MLLVAGCGKMADLEPAAGKPLPMKPMMARATPTPNELLAPPAYANPDRVDELMPKSTPRQSDRFDLPPPSGLSPAAAAQAPGNEVTNDASPEPPQ